MDSVVAVHLCASEPYKVPYNNFFKGIYKGFIRGFIRVYKKLR